MVRQGATRRRLIDRFRGSDGASQHGVGAVDVIRPRMIDEERSHVKLGDEKGEETTSEDGMRRLRFHRLVPQWVET
jgi:hypothetical protein